MIDKQQAVEELVVELEDIVMNALDKKDAEHEGLIFLDKYSTIDNEGYLQYRLRYLLSRFGDIKKET